MSHITVVGSVNMDLVVRTSRVPERGETLSGLDFGIFPGGKGANQAVAAARQGAGVAMVGCVGRDSFGETMLAALRAAGIDTRFVTVDPATPTGVALITVEESGDNRIILVAGANGRMSADRVSAAHAVFAPGGILLMQLEIPLPAVRQAAALARAQGMQIILNAAPAQRLDAALLALVDYLVVNEIEAAALAGRPSGRPAEAAAALRQQGVRNLVITRGDEGALFFDAAGSLAVPAFRVPVVDTTAAGDAFVGAFAVALTEGRPVREAIRWGNAAGALAVTRSGAQPSLPSRADTEALSRL